MADTNPINVIKNDKKTKICFICKKTYCNKSNLKRHMKLHTRINLYRCTVCPQQCVTQQHLVQHMARHTGHKPYKCENCSMSFVTKTELNLHNIRMHIKAKPFKCNICDKLFVTRHEHKKHIVIHTTVKRYKCDKCLQKFSYLINYKIHQRRRRYKCDICLSEFCILKLLKIHMEIHSGCSPRTFKCNRCPMTFYTAKQLTTHNKIHNKQYKCLVCKQIFTILFQLNYHKCKRAAVVSVTAMENQNVVEDVAATVNATIANATDLMHRTNDEIVDNKNTCEIKIEFQSINKSIRNSAFDESNKSDDFNQLEIINNNNNNEQKLKEELLQMNPELDWIADDEIESETTTVTTSMMIKEELIDGNEFDIVETQDPEIVDEQLNYELVSQLEIIEMKCEIIYEESDV